ncbi:MAG: hypothetical protein U1C56_01050 [Candidatus Curtissbacteria bacterium]|nr:hypothetical protein [bacterium]MDZ4209747.1 hypothetical protein [Candidatus Curtissbacteria bacterium]
MLLGIKFIDEGVVDGLNKVVRSIIPERTKMLDKAATDTLVKMTQEAPEATGRLRANIKIDRLGSFLTDRIIYPDVEYGFYQETRHRMTQRRPPIEKIQEWAQTVGAGDTKSVAFLIARKIQNAGYPSNPFVLRTYRWVQVQMVKHAQNFLNIVAAQYMAGRETKTFKV